MTNAISLFNIADQAEMTRSARTIPMPIEEVQPSEETTPTGASKNGKIVLPTMEGMCFEKIKHINYLEASGNYTVLHFTDARQVLVCKTLRELEQMLPEESFARIHRSHTVHLKHLKKYVRGKGGHVVLQNGATLAVSSGQKEWFIQAVRSYYTK
jgi:two-component system, LytTR family, response regulator